jgi:hypothetical protein
VINHPLANQAPLIAMSSPIFNTRLPFAEEYASLPGVKTVHGLFSRHVGVVNATRELMLLHDVTNKFVLFALHKHFEVPTGCVLLQQRVTLPDNSLGEVVHPVPADFVITHKAQPVAFFVSGNKLQPYKYACDAGLTPDYSTASSFLKDFVALLKAHSADTLFALKLLNVSPNIHMAEGEIPEYSATVLVPKHYLPVDDTNAAQASVNFAECAANESHASNLRGNHTVFVGTGGTAPVYFAALAAIQNVSRTFK